MSFVHRHFVCFFLWFSVTPWLPAGESVGRAQDQRAKPEIAAANILSVMSFNIRYNNPNDGLDAWPSRRDHVADVIRSQDTDVVGLQEVLLDQIEDLQTRLPDYQWYGVGRDDGKEQGEFGPIFYRADRWEVREKGHFWLSQRPNEPGRCDWQAACPRMATWLKLRDKSSGRTFVVLNTHFDHRSREARQKGAELIRRRLGTFTESAIVVTGDFNCLATSETYQFLTGPPDEDPTSPRLYDAYQIAERGHDGPDSTWNGFREIIPGRRIDFILVTKQVGIERHRILPAKRDGRFASDHLPVLAELALPNS